MKQLQWWFTLLFLSSVTLFSFQTVFAEIISIPHQACLPKQHWGSNLVTYYHSNGASAQPFPDGTEQIFYCPLILPHNAIISNVTLECHDHTGGATGGNVSASLQEFKYNTGSASFADFDTGIADAPGDIRILVENIDLLINNAENHYGLNVSMTNPVSSDSGAISFSKFIVEYELDTPQTKNKVVVVPLFK